MQKYYTAKMDRLLTLTTRVIWGVLLLPPVIMALNLFGANGGAPAGKFLPLTTAGVTLLIAAIAYFTRALAPRGFELNDLQITVDRAVQPVVIPLASVTEARLLAEAELKNCLRIMGASGFYGHYGWFWNRPLGRFRMYACRSKDLVLVRAGKDIFVLGPDEPAVFVADLGPLLRR